MGDSRLSGQVRRRSLVSENGDPPGGFDPQLDSIPDDLQNPNLNRRLALGAKHTFTDLPRQYQHRGFLILSEMVIDPSKHIWKLKRFGILPE